MINERLLIKGKINIFLNNKFIIFISINLLSKIVFMQDGYV